MATDSPISPHRCTLLEETRVGGKSVIPEKWFQTITYFSQTKKKSYLLSVMYNHQSNKRFCTDKQAQKEHFIPYWKMDADLIRAQGDLAVDYFFEEKFYVSFCFDFLIFSEWFQVQLGKLSCIVSFGKESGFDVKKKGALLQPFCTVDRSCAKLFLCTCYLNSPCCANLVPLRHKNLFEKTLTVVLHYHSGIFLLYYIS